MSFSACFWRGVPPGPAEWRTNLFQTLWFALFLGLKLHQLDRTERHANPDLRPSHNHRDRAEYKAGHAKPRFARSTGQSADRNTRTSASLLVAKGITTSSKKLLASDALATTSDAEGELANTRSGRAVTTCVLQAILNNKEPPSTSSMDCISCTYLFNLSPCPFWPGPGHRSGSPALAFGAPPPKSKGQPTEGLQPKTLILYTQKPSSSFFCAQE